MKAFTRHIANACSDSGTRVAQKGFAGWGIHLACVAGAKKTPQQILDTAA